MEILSTTACYTQAEAAERLHLTLQDFQKQLATGELPSSLAIDETAFDADKVDTIAMRREHDILANSTAPIDFMRATEKDLQDITWLHEELYHEKEPAGSHQSRVQRYLQNPEMYYLAKQEGILLGFIGQIPLKQAIMADIMVIEDESTEATYNRLDKDLILPENITPMTEGFVAHVYISLGVKQGLLQSAEAGYKLMHGYIDLLKDYARRGIIVENLYAISETDQGQRCCRAFNFIESYVPYIPLQRFKLDLLTSDCLWAQTYQQVVFSLYPEIKTLVYSREHRAATHIEPFATIF
jgi:hypothetical protein